MKKLLLAILFIHLGICGAVAQDNSADDFWAERERMLSEFQDFRKEINEEYVSFLKEEWKEYNLEKGIAPELGPKPNSVPMASAQTNVYSDEVLAVEKEVQAEPVEQFTVKKPTREPQNNKKIFLSFYGSKISTEHNLSAKSLAKVRDGDIANLWQYFSKSNFENMVLDILQYKETHNLNDWAMYKLTTAASKQIPELADRNAKVAFTHFLLTQCGYNLRMCTSGNNLALMVPIYETIYDWNFYNTDGFRHYILSDYEMSNVNTIKTSDFNKKTKGAPLSVKVNKSILFSQQSHHNLIKYKDFSSLVSVNKNLINFYSDYPQCDLSLYPSAPVSELSSKSLLRDINNYVRGKDQKETLQWLLHFVQNGFAYKTDTQQFGREKPFFMEEIFYYPYSDCEDRAFLFQWLVKNILKMDAVLLSYPNHLATAVCLEPFSKGSFIRYKDKKYIICDPTYINSDIGQYMPEYEGVSPKVI